MIKIKTVLTSLFICMVVFLTACNSFKYKYLDETRYIDWVEQVGLFSHDNLKVTEYSERGNNIEIELEFDNGSDGYKELCDFVNAHNKFVESYPDYFPEDINIHIINRHASEESVSAFFNSNISEYLEDLERPSTPKLQYMSIRMKDDYTEVQENKDIEIDVPVIILQNGYNYIPPNDVYAFLSECTCAEQIIIDYSAEYDQEEVCSTIREYLPDVEIYSVVSTDKEQHLEKCQ